MNRKTLEKLTIYILLFIAGYMSASLWSKEGMENGTECYDDSECDSGWKCKDEVCVEEGEIECENDNDCDDELVCKESKCVEKTAECEDDDDCEGEATCRGKGNSRVCVEPGPGTPVYLQVILWILALIFFVAIVAASPWGLGAVVRDWQD